MNRRRGQRIHVPLEHAALAQGTSDQDRTRVFARYSLIGALSIAAGALAAAAPDILIASEQLRIGALQAMFYVYAAFATGAALIPFCRGPRRRNQQPRPPPQPSPDRLQAGRPVQPGPLRAALSSSRSWRCGCSSASICRSSPPAPSSSGRTFSPPSYPVAARARRRFGLVKRWSSRISRRASASFSRPSRRT